MSTTKRVNSTLIQNPYYFLTLPIPKQKRIKSNPVPSKSYNIPTVPRDSHGLPLLPLNVGIMTLMSLGSICFRQKFHSERYIFPVGYEVTRRYLSTVSPTAQVVYHCTIIDGGDSPKFQVVGADRVDRPVIASTATGAWSVIVKEANRIRKRTHSNSVSGPDFFGLGQNTIRHLIQQLPGAEKLAKRDQPSDDGGGFYVWQHYTEGGPLGGRHAAVIPALPDDFESAIGPIGEYIPPRIIQARYLFR
ncbi:hypothetical protein GYMLUDRAFT_525405 [Collybiopsis luxurians FD-317 M1]|nr:hypothetical protein GYMLUDRAFT_525405 [Collybiopsis luxurians FD-317 M1]